MIFLEDYIIIWKNQRRQNVIKITYSGLAYSMGAYVDLQEGWGWLEAYIGTAPANIETALKGMKEQITSAAEGRFSERETQTAVNSYIGRRNMRLLTSVNRAMYYGLYAFEGEPLDYSEEWAERIKAVKAEDVNRAAQQYFRVGEDLVAVVVE